MGRLAIVRLFERVLKGIAKGSEVVSDPGGGANVRSDHFAPIGDDSYPLDGDYVALVDGSGGREIAVGYADPKNPQESGPGERHIYSRDPATGLLIAGIHLKADGSLDITTPAATVGISAIGVLTIATDIVATINGVSIDASGNINTSGTITAAQVIAGGKSLAIHTHPAGTPPGPTGPNT